MKRILVTGGAGFVGSHLCEYLLNQGNEVICLDNYFTGKKEVPRISRYMLMEFDIKPERVKELAGVVHVDGTSRIQTLASRDENPFLYDLLHVLQKHYGIRALLNTSFNAKGKPLVHTRADAMQEAREMGMEHFIFNGRLVKIPD